MEISIEYRFRTLSEFRTMMFVEVFDMFINGKPMGFKYVKDTDKPHEPSVSFDVYTDKLDNEPIDIDGIHFIPVEYGYCCHNEQQVRVLYDYLVKNNLLPEDVIYG